MTSPFEPGFYAIGGELGSGKSFDIGKSLIGATVIEAGTGDMGALTMPCLRAGGFRPSAVHGLSGNLSQMMDWCTGKGKETIQRSGALIIDDATLLVEDSVTHWRQNNPGGNAYYAFNRRDLLMKNFRRLTDELGVLVVALFHIKMGQKKDGVSVAQGRLSVGVNKVEASNDVSASAYSVWRYVNWPQGPNPWWSKRYFCGSDDSEFPGKDRNDVLGAINPYGPANFREYMRKATRRPLPRLPGLDWQDEIADYVAGEMDKGAKVLDVIRALLGTAGNADERHLRWAIDDGIARHGYRHLRGIFDVFDLPSRVANVGLPPGGGLPPTNGAGAPASGSSTAAPAATHATSVTPVMTAPASAVVPAGS